MATSSVTGNHDSAEDSADDDTRILGPSDSSDSGSDMQGVPGQDPEELDNDSDAAGTGERAGVEPRNTAPDGGDIDVDHVESMAPVRPAEDGDGEPGAPQAPVPRP